MKFVTNLIRYKLANGFGLLLFGISALVAQEEDGSPNPKSRHNTGHYSTPNYEFYAEEPRYPEKAPIDPEGKKEISQNVRGRVSIMPGVFVGPRGITVFVDGKRVIGQHIDMRVRGGLLEIADAAKFFKEKNEVNPKLGSWAEGKTNVVVSSKRLQQEFAASMTEKIVDELTKAKFSAYVNFSTSPPQVDDLARAEILSAIFNLDPPKDSDAAKKIFEKLTADYPGFNPYTMYSFQFLAPRSFRAELSLAGREAQELSAGLKAEASSGSTYGFYLEDLSYLELQMLMLGLFEISINGTVDLSQAQQLVAEFDYEKLVNQLTTDFFSRRIVTESKSGRRWLKKYTSASVETFLTHEQNSVSDSDISSGVSIQMRDFRDPKVIEKMYDFIFPPSSTSLTLEQLIAKHVAAMDAPGVSDEAKKLHSEYVAHLKELQAGSKVDLAASEEKFVNAVVDLGQNEKQKAWINAVVSFLQAGFGGSYDSSNSLLEVRQLNSYEYYEQRKYAFNALLFDTVEAGLSISKAYFVEAPLVSSEKGDLEELIFDSCSKGVEQLFQPNAAPLSLGDFLQKFEIPKEEIKPFFPPSSPFGPGIPEGPYNLHKLPYKSLKASDPSQ